LAENGMEGHVEDEFPEVKVDFQVKASRNQDIKKYELLLPTFKSFHVSMFCLLDTHLIPYLEFSSLFLLEYH
jgi:hypothetical protein